MNENSVVAVYGTHEEAEGAVKELQGCGFDVKKLSIVGKDCHLEEQVIGYDDAGDRMKYQGKLAALWGGLWGLPFGAAFFWVPGIGPVVVGGPLVSWIVGALEGAAIVGGLGGLSALGAGLYSMGVPRDSVLRYERAVRNDQYLLVADGTAEEVQRTTRFLKRSEAQAVESYVTASAPVWSQRSIGPVYQWGRRAACCGSR